MKHLRSHELIRPLPAYAAPEDVAPGDVVEITITDWMVGETTLEAKVTTPVRDGHVGIVIEAGSEKRSYSVAVADLTLVRRAGA